MTTYDGNKQQIRIALIDIRPADQVILKGYFRLLFTLNKEPVWVSVTDDCIDLFIVNNDSRHADNVLTILNANKDSAVLYIQRNKSPSEEAICDDVLNIPLRQINLLNDWLSNQGLLTSQKPAIHSNDDEVQQAPAPAPTPAPSEESTELSAPPKSGANLDNLIEIVNVVYQRPQSFFELIEDDKVVAIIDAHRHLLWEKRPIKQIHTDLKLRQYEGLIPPDDRAKDVGQWLWYLAYHHPDVLLPFIEHTTRYQLSSRVEPLAKGRREVLDIMTAIESHPMNISEIANHSGVPAMLVKKTLAALLFSGHLNHESHQDLGEVVLRTTAKPVTATPEVVEMIEEEYIEEHEEKSSFLSRIRQRLGRNQHS